MLFKAICGIKADKGDNIAQSRAIFIYSAHKLHRTIGVHSLTRVDPKKLTVIFFSRISQHFTVFLAVTATGISEKNPLILGKALINHVLHAVVELSVLDTRSKAHAIVLTKVGDGVPVCVHKLDAKASFER